MPKKKIASRPVLICTAKRGVFFGYGEDTSGSTVRLTECRMVVYWSQDTCGVVGLAATGPTKACRVTKPAPAAELREVTAVFDCSPEAVAAFGASPWA